MTIEHARQVINAVSEKQRAALSAAHERYMHFAGDDTVAVRRVSVEQVAEDRARFVHLLKFTDDGWPSLSDERCAEFMAAITELPRELCLAWGEVEFFETHTEETHASFYS